MFNKVDWDSEAKRAANRVGDEMFEAHRGAMPWGQVGVSVVFGNDGYGADQRARREVAGVRRGLAEHGVAELGFGTRDDDGYAWAMIVQSGDIAFLESLVWGAWGVACGTDVEGGGLGADDIQRGIARKTIAEQGDPPPMTSIN